MQFNPVNCIRFGLLEYHLVSCIISNLTYLLCLHKFISTRNEKPGSGADGVSFLKFFFVVKHLFKFFCYHKPS